MVCGFLASLLLSVPWPPWTGSLSALAGFTTLPFNMSAASAQPLLWVASQLKNGRDPFKAITQIMPFLCWSLDCFLYRLGKIRVPSTAFEDFVTYMTFHSSFDPSLPTCLFPPWLQTPWSPCCTSSTWGTSSTKTLGCLITGNSSLRYWHCGHSDHLELTWSDSTFSKKSSTIKN